MLLTMTMLLYVSDLSNPKYDDTSLDNSTKLKFGTVGNSFQRSPRLGKLLHFCKYNSSRFRCSNDQKRMKAHDGCIKRCSTRLSYTPIPPRRPRRANTSSEVAFMTMACYRSTSIPVYAVYCSISLCSQCDFDDFPVENLQLYKLRKNLPPTQ